MASKAVIACAGSGKTRYLVEEAASRSGSRVLITTYTNENTANLREELLRRFGCIPANVSVVTWYSMLLTHGVRPYHNLVSNVRLARSITLLPMSESARFVPKTDVDRRYFTPGGHMYVDRVSEFICLLDEHTRGKVVARLKAIFDVILIDEMQDLNGYDLDFIQKLLKAGIEVIGVCDPRQATFVTNRSLRNRGVARSRIVDWLEKLEATKLLTTETRAESWRSNQEICDFADSLYPDLPKTISRNAQITGHDGVHEISPRDVPAYVDTHQPTVLRWDKRTDTLGLRAMNIGVSKGRTFDRVLIFPTEKMKVYLRTRRPSDAGDLARFYVAVTRARFSVAFVV